MVSWDHLHHMTMALIELHHLNHIMIDVARVTISHCGLQHRPTQSNEMTPPMQNYGMSTMLVPEHFSIAEIILDYFHI